MINPHFESVPERYSRLFEPLDIEAQQEMTSERLDALAGSMQDPHDETPIPIPLLLGREMPAAGYTYFGQFIDHDLTYDLTPLREAGKREPKDTVNYRTPWLDLDHLYGEGPGPSSKDRHLYAADGASFLLGKPLFHGEAFDVPVDEKGIPQMVDPRNGENLIIRQVHALFLKLHNAAVKELPEGLSAAEKFERARNRVRWQYQWLVRHDFLANMCAKSVYEAIIQRGERHFAWKNSSFSIPVEFASAAMRFGHSLIRKDYELNDIPAAEGGMGRVNLGKLFGVNNRGPLHPFFKIDWNKFLNPPEISMAIDTMIVSPLFQLPDEDIDYFVSTNVPHPPRSLPLRTLLRGAANKLPTGQEIRRQLGVQDDIPLPPVEYQLSPWRHLEAVQLAAQTPLWYYVLLEAQLEERGGALGTVGSRLVAEVIEGSLQMDDQSFLRQGWEPDLWKTSTGDSIPIEKLQDVVTVVGV